MSTADLVDDQSAGLRVIEQDGSSLASSKRSVGVMEKPTGGSLSPSQRTTFDSRAQRRPRATVSGASADKELDKRSWFRSGWHQNGTILPEASKMGDLPTENPRIS